MKMIVIPFIVMLNLILRKILLLPMDLKVKNIKKEQNVLNGSM